VTKVGDITKITVTMSGTSGYLGTSHRRNVDLWELIWPVCTLRRKQKLW